MRIVAVMLIDVPISNIYLSAMVVGAEYDELLICIWHDLPSGFLESDAEHAIVGSDCICDFRSESLGRQYLNNFMLLLNLAASCCCNEHAGACKRQRNERQAEGTH
jgi:hypothetical protein